MLSAHGRVIGRLARSFGLGLLPPALSFILFPRSILLPARISAADTTSCWLEKYACRPSKAHSRWVLSSFPIDGRNQAR